MRPLLDTSRMHFLRVAFAAAALCTLAGIATAASNATATDPDSVLAHVNARVMGKTQFAYEWTALNPTVRPTGDPVAARQAYLDQLVDRMLLGDAALAMNYPWTAADSADFKRVRRRALQNEYFDDIIGRRVKVDMSPEAIEIFRARMTTIPLLRIFRFPDLPQARAWRQRLATGTPMSRLEALAQAAGPDAPRIDTLGFVPWEQLPESLRVPVFKLKVGQISDAMMVEGLGSFIQVLRTRVRPSITVQNNDVDEIRMTLRNEALNEAREDYRRRLREELKVRYEDKGVNLLLAKFQAFAPRVTTEGGISSVSANMPAPTVTPEEAAVVLASYSTGRLTVGEFVEWYTGLESTMRSEIRTRQMLEIAADRPLFDNEIAYRAEAGHYETRPEVVEILEFRKEGYAVQHYYDDQILSKVKMEPDSLRAFFTRNPGRWDTPEAVEPRIMLVESKSVADSLALALRAGSDFANAATLWSIHESAARGGSLGTIYKGQQPDSTMEKMLFEAPVGQVVGPIPVQNGYLILLVTKHDAPVIRDFEAALMYVTNEYRTEKSDELLKARLAELRKKAAPRIYPERVTADLGSND